MKRRRFIQTGSMAAFGTAAFPGIATEAFNHESADKNIEKVYLIFKTHLDIGFTDLAGNVIQKYMTDFIPRAMDLARETRENDPSHRFVWTTGSWLIYHFLEETDSVMRGKMEAAIAKGDIVWHALPFTTHSELADPSLYELGLQLSGILDKRFGKKTIAGKMTDVPGHTRSIVPLLAKNNIEFLHIGVNAASMPPDVPPLFRWRSPDGSEITVMYQADYGNTMIIPGTKKAVSLSFTGDNHGPQSPEQVAEVYKNLQKQFPRAQIIAATLNDMAYGVSGIQNDLPLVTEELGDSWIHGVGSDPYKIAQLREMSRLRHELLKNQAFQKGDSTDLAFGIPLLMVAEHTWGLDVKTWLKDWDKYKPADFEAARSQPKYKLMEESWNEKRQYIRDAVTHLPGQEYANERLDKLKPVQTDKSSYIKQEKNDFSIETTFYSVQIDSIAGGIIGLKDKSTGIDWAGKQHPLFQFAYQTFSKGDYDRFLNQYLTQKYEWAQGDFGKPGQEIGGAISKTWLPTVSGIFTKQDGKGTAILIELAVSDEHNKAVGGSPGTIVTELFFPEDRKEIQSTLKWFDKLAYRLPEAAWFSFIPVVENGDWILDKMNQPVNFRNIVKNGNRKLHAILKDVKFENNKQECSLESLDASLVAPGERNLLNFDNLLPEATNGIHFCLHNNVWGTNFTMWFEEDMKYRFNFKT